MMPGPVSSKVDGVLYLDINSEDLARLDHFEGSIYDRRNVQVMTGNNIYAAQAYVVKKSYHSLLSDREWDPKKFQDEGIHRFLGGYFGFDR